MIWGSGLNSSEMELVKNLYEKGWDLDLNNNWKEKIIHLTFEIFEIKLLIFLSVLKKLQVKLDL